MAHQRETINKFRQQAQKQKHHPRALGGCECRMVWTDATVVVENSTPLILPKLQLGVSGRVKYEPFLTVCPIAQ
jgi:hypothetical protein